MIRQSLIAIILAYTIHASPPPYFSIGGLFQTFAITDSDLTLTRQDSGSQYLAAFIMAVDEINNKNDGIRDDLLPATELRIICEIGVGVLALYPPNDFVNGASRALSLRFKDRLLIAGVDGSMIDDSTSATAQTLNNWGILDFISRSTSADYAHSDSFPLTLQNTPSQISEALSLVTLWTQSYRWKNVAVFFIYDTKVGLDATIAFQGSLPSVGVNLLGSYPIKTGQIDFELPISQAKKTGATIFAIFLDGTTAGRLLEQGYNAGLFNEGTQVMATSTSDIVGIRNALTPAGRLNEANILKGFMSTAPHPEYYFQSPLGQSFVTRFRKLPPTITVDPVSNATTCDLRVDASRPGKSYLYQIAQKNKNKIPSNLCLGFKSFTSFNQDGSNIDPYTMYIYDAVYALAGSLNTLLYGNRKSSEDTISEIKIYNTSAALIKGSGVSHDDYGRGRGMGRGGSDWSHDMKIAPHNSSPLSSAAFSSLISGAGMLSEESGAFEQHERNNHADLLFDALLTEQQLSDVEVLTTTSTNITAAQLHSAMISQSANYAGMVTGNTKFTGNGGTRRVGNAFKLMNYKQKGSGSESNGLAFVGEYNDATGWLRCGITSETQLMSAFDLARCNDIIYRNTISSQPPSDTLPDITKTLARSYRTPLIFFAAVGLALLVACVIYVALHWNEKMMRRSQPVLHLIIFLGAFCGLVKVLLSAAPVNRSNCVAQMWLQHLSFRLILRTLLLKLWRVHVIVNSSGKKRRAIGLKTVLTYIAVDMLLLISLLSAITQTTTEQYNASSGYDVSSYNRLMKIETETSFNQRTVEAFCSAPKVRSVAFFLNSILYAYEALYLLHFAYYVYLTRELPSSIRAAGTAGKGKL